MCGNEDYENRIALFCFVLHTSLRPEIVTANGHDDVFCRLERVNSQLFDLRMYNIAVSIVCFIEGTINCIHFDFDVFPSLTRVLITIDNIDSMCWTVLNCIRIVLDCVRRMVEKMFIKYLHTAYLPYR